MKQNRAQRVETNLIVQQEVFERAYLSLLNGLKYVDKKGQDILKSAHSESEGERKREAQNLQKSLLALIMVIQKLKHNIKNEHFVENHDTDYLRGQLTSIEENLASFKGLLAEQIQVLQEEEKDLQYSIESLHERLNEASNSSTGNQSENSNTSAVKIKAKSRICTQTNDSVHPDVQEYRLFLESNGGHTGGWDTKDHLLFTRFLQKYRGLDHMTTALLDFMPDKTPQEIAQHESWYHDYLTLKDAQRRALKEWRNEHHSQKKNYEITDDTTQHPATSVTQNSITTSNQRDPLIKEKIRKWKEKQEKLRQEQIQDLQEKKKQEDELWRKKVAYFEQQRKLIATQRKEQQHIVNKEKSGEPDSIKIPNKKQIPLKELWEQDKLYMLRRQSRIQRFSASPRDHSSSQTTVHAERDPARLLRPTAVWSNRVRRSLSEDGSKKIQGNQVSLYIADVPRLAIPKWREGLV